MTRVPAAWLDGKQVAVRPAWGVIAEALRE